MTEQLLNLKIRAEVEVPVIGGDVTRMRLATRQTTLTAGQDVLPVLEVRRLTRTGHQTAIITTARRLESPAIAGRMFSRWCQENFFAYMMHHFDIDGLVQYGSEEIPGTTLIVNPAWRTLDRAVKDARVRIHRMASPAHDKAIGALLANLNHSDIRHPETGMRLIYELA